MPPPSPIPLSLPTVHSPLSSAIEPPHKSGAAVVQTKNFCIDPSPLIRACTLFYPNLSTSTLHRRPPPTSLVLHLHNVVLLLLLLLLLPHHTANCYSLRASVLRSAYTHKPLGEEVTGKDRAWGVMVLGTLGRRR